MSDRLQYVADRLGRMIEEAESAAAFADGRDGHAEAMHLEGRVEALREFVGAVSGLEPGADPTAQAIASARSILDEDARSLPNAVDRGRIEGRLAALAEVVLMLVRLRAGPR